MQSAISTCPGRHWGSYILGLLGGSEIIQTSTKLLHKRRPTYAAETSITHHDNGFDEVNYNDDDTGSILGLHQLIPLLLWLSDQVSGRARSIQEQGTHTL